MLPSLTLIGVLVQTVQQVFSTGLVSLDVLEGHPVRLNVTTFEDRSKIRISTWSYGTSDVVLYYTTSDDTKIFPNYQKRVDFNPKDFSLTLKDPQKTDSGVYKAKIGLQVRDRARETTDIYHLSVHEHAAVPTLTVLSIQSSPDVCHVTLSCSGGADLSLISNCSKTFNASHTIICSQEEGEDRFLVISSNQSTVSCNHSNSVSWSLETVELQPLCLFYGGGSSSPACMSPCQLRAVVLSIILVAMTSAVIGVHLREKLHKKD